MAMWLVLYQRVRKFFLNVAQALADSIQCK